jgi:hypothetical protein
MKDPLKTPSSIRVVALDYLINKLMKNRGLAMDALDVHS